MFARFQLDVSHAFFGVEINRPENLTEGRKLYEKFGQESYDCLKKFICENGEIDGTALKEHWFGITQADVFLSHSHKDINKVKAFAGWLYNSFGLKSFIDSCTWGYANDLLRLLDNKYCWNAGSKTYNYDLRNHTTSHVHVMLSTALTEMIDTTECLMFYNTPNSIKISEEIKNTKDGRERETDSPWIYHELSIGSMIRTEKPKRHSTILEHRADFAQDSQEKLQITYKIERAVNTMITLNENGIVAWKDSWDKHEHPLDTLYKLITG